MRLKRQPEIVILHKLINRGLAFVSGSVGSAIGGTMLTGEGAGAAGGAAGGGAGPGLTAMVDQVRLLLRLSNFDLLCLFCN